MPLVEPKISSITVGLTQFERWVDEWDEYNCRVELDTEGCVFGEDSDGDPLLLECYGEDRPRPPPPVVVRASEKPYVTVPDYLTAVHPCGGRS